MDRVGIPTIIGRTAAQEANDHKLFVAEARQPYTGELDDEGWVLVNKYELAVAKYMYDSTPILQIPGQYIQNSFLQGGLTIKVGSGASKTFKPDDLFGKTILNWICTMHTNWWIYGFTVAMTAEPRPELRPLYNRLEDTFEQVQQQLFTIPVEQVDIWFKLNMLGEPQWIVCKPPSAKDFTSGKTQLPGPTGMRGTPIPNCFVFWKTHPDANGHPKSPVLALSGDWHYFREQQALNLLAAKKRAAPDWILEHHSAKENPPIGGTVPFENEAIQQREQFITRMVRFENCFTELEQANINKYTATLDSLVREQLQQSVGGGHLVNLPPDKKLVKQVQAEGPGTDLLKETIHFHQQVLLAAGVPPAMVQPESTHGKMVSNENAQKVYDQHLAAEKHRVLVPVQIMLRQLYQRKLWLQYAQRYKPSLQELVSQTKIVVTMPGIPPIERLDQYYLSGLLKHEAYVKYLSSIHGMPIEDFETTPKISQMDLLTAGKTTLEEMKAENAGPPAKKKQKTSSR